MENSQQPHTERVQVRLTPRMRRAIARHCNIQDLGENDMIRYLIEAGLNLVEKSGLPAVMAERSHFLGAEFPPPANKRGPKPRIPRARKK